MSTAEDSAPSPVSRPIHQALITVGIAAAVLVLGRLVLLVSSGGPGEIAPLALLDWGVLCWAVLVALVTVLHRTDAPIARARLFVVAAAVSAGVSFVIRALPDVTRVGAEAFLWHVPALIVDGIGLVLAAVIGSIAAVGILATGGRATSGRVATGVGLGALVIGGVLVLALAWQFFGVYFRLFGGEVVVTDDQANRYLVTAALAIALPVAAAIIGGVRRNRALLGWGIGIAILALLTAFVLQVPTGRFWVEPGGSNVDVNDDYVPCFGEGDPNCIGG